MTERDAYPETPKVIPVQRSTADKIHPEKDAVPSAASAPVNNVACRAGDESCANAHASMLHRATSGKRARAGQSLLELQRQYGNRYVERVLALSREPANEEVNPSGQVENAIESKRGGGQNLDTGVRKQMETALGADLTGVRVHTDNQSDSLNRSLNARAFTTGQDIFFSQGAYQPGSSTGRELIAHEVTHVVQQGGGEVRRAMTVSQPGDPHEVEAEQTARAIVQSEHDSALQRQPESKKDDEEEKKKHSAAMPADHSRPLSKSNT
jgi:Domain of unknown function (DUF4157)